MSDRTVHGWTKDGAQIVRYDRSGKYYIEPWDSKRSHVTLAVAVEAALLGKAVFGRPGGMRFDAAVRAATPKDGE